MPSLPHNIASFFKHAGGYLKAAQKAEPGHTQAIRAKYARDFLTDIGITYEGPTQQEIQNIGPCIYVANHNSTLDAVIICAFFEGDLRILAKESLFKIPYLGKILRLENHIMVHRGKNASARNTNIRESIQKAIHDKASVLFFPEGTRSKDGNLADFKLGAFYNAIQTHVPVVPILITGTFEAMPKTTLKIKPAKCTLKLLAPIELPDEKKGDEKTRAQLLADNAKNAILKAMNAQKPQTNEHAVTAAEKNDTKESKESIECRANDLK